MSKKQGCMAGVMLGSLIKFFLTGFWMLIKVIASLIWFFGLWLPAAYALFGLILYWVFGFNPLKLELEDSCIFRDSSLAAYAALLFQEFDCQVR